MSQSTFDRIVGDIFSGDLFTVRGDQPSKQEQVAVTAEQKQAEIRRLSDPDEAYQAVVGAEEGYGEASASQVERDFRNMTPLELEWKYGADIALELRRSGVEAAKRSYFDKITPQSNTELAQDFGISAAQGLVGGFGDLGSLALSGAGAATEGLAGFVFPKNSLDAQGKAKEFSDDLGKLGVQLGERMQEFREAGDSLKSDRGQRQMVRDAAVSANAARDREAQYVEDLKNGNTTVADAKRFFREFGDSLAIGSDSASSLANLGGEALGSLGTDVLLAAGGVGIAKKISDLKGVAGKVAKTGSASASIAAQEAGGVYTQAALEVLDQTEGSERFSEEERYQLANAAGQIAAKTQAPVAAVTGLLISKFVANPITGTSLRKVVSNMVNEGIEEVIQSGSGAVAVNRGLKETVNPEEDLLEGAGVEAASGLLGGVAAGGIGSVPGVAVDTAKLTKETAETLGKATLWAGSVAAPFVKAGASKAAEGMRSAVSRYEQVLEENRKSSPVSKEKVKAGLDNAVRIYEGTRDKLTEVSEPARNFVDRLYKATRFDPALLDDTVSTPVREALESAQDKMDAVERLALVMENSDDGSDEQLSAARLLLQIQSEVLDLAEASRAAELQDLPKGSPALRLASRLGASLAALKSNNQFKNALETAQEKIGQAVETGKIKIVEATEVATAEGRKHIANAIAAAQFKPEKASLEANQKILEHADSGSIQLTPLQRQSLLASSTLIQAERDRLASNEEQGLSTTEDLVSGQIISDRSSGEDGGYPSLAQHVKRITSAYRAGDTETAKEFLADLMLFAQHMQNKVSAYNSHIAKGGGGENTGVTYKTLTPQGRRWVNSARPAFVQPTSEKSVRFAQTVAKEAQIVGEVANQLAEIFGELETDPIDVVELDASLQGDPAEVSKKAAVEKRTRNSKKASERAKQKSKETKREDSAASAGSEKQENEELRKLREQLAAAEARITELETTDEASAPEAEKQDTVEDLASEPVQEGPSEAELEAEAKREESTDAVDSEKPVDEVIEEAVDTAISEAVSEAVSEALEEVSQEEAPVEPEPVETLPEPSEPAPADNSVLNLYPNLSRGEENLFVQAFELPEEGNENAILGMPNPLRSVLRLLPQTLPAIEAAYEEYQEFGQELVDEMQRRLKDWLSKPDSKKDKRTREEKYLSEGKLAQYERGRALNITELDGDTLRYNPELLESATLAALQWMLVAKDRIPVRDEDDLPGIMGISREEAEKLASREEELLNEYQRGLTNVEASRSLAAMIRNYWGLKSKSSAPIGDIEGISEAIAKELLMLLVKGGAIQRIEPMKNVFGNENPLEDKRSPYVLIPNDLAENDPLREARDLIERAVMGENAQRADWVGAPPQAVAKTQLHNPRVKLTTEQRAAIRSRQNVPYKLNSTMFNFYQKLGETGVLSLFGGGEIDENNLNAAHQLTLEGRNQTFRSAYSSVLDLVSRIRAEAEEKGTEATDVPVFFEYTFNSMNRLQMLGANNPQSSKLMREVLLPTSSKLDLSSLNSPGMTGFLVAIGQHVGKKVELNRPDEVAGEVLKDLGSRYANSVSGLQEWLREGGELPEDLIDTLKAELGGDTSPVAVHSLMEYARWLNASPEERAGFETALYLEADGKTNGPMNGMALFSVGEFSAEWIDNMERGGLFIGEEKAYYEHQGGDLYQTSSDALQRIILEKLPKYEQPVINQVGYLLTLMSQLVGKDVQFDGENLTFKRGISKNPLTVTLYGSQAGGIANKLTKALDRAMTERMSDARRRLNENSQLSMAEAMFPDSVDAEEDMDLFLEAMGALQSSRVFRGREGLYVKGRQDGPAPQINLREFSLDGETFKAVSQNMKMLIVEPMQQAIEETVGSPLMDALTRIRQATQVQSLILATEFEKAIQRKIEEKKKAGTYRKAGFLSRKELDEIFESLSDLAPILETEGQRFFIANSQRSDLSEEEFSATLDDQFRTPGFVNGPADAGVRGIPSLVIGSGDGTMMQIFGAMRDWAQKTLDVYDGLNVPLDSLEEFSRRINWAVNESWQRNPMKGVSDTFSQFSKNAKLTNLTQKQLVDLSRALFNNWDTDNPNSPDEIREAIAELREQLERDAIEIEARHNALARVNLSVDQMAGFGSPHVENGKISLRGDSLQKAQVLNQIYVEELKKLQAKADEKAGRAARNEAQVLEPVDIRVLARKMEMDKQQQKLLETLLGPVADRGYRVIQGDLAQVNNFLVAEGLPPISMPSDRKINGVTLPGSKIVALFNPTPEVLVHELIHAATFEKVDAYYEGRDLGENSVEQLRAIERIEALFWQFNELDVSGESEATQQAYFDARTTIDEHLANGRDAEALNEFMAWGLANQNLVKLQKNKVASPLARIAQRVVETLRKLLFGGSRTTKPMYDMLSNLRFNTEILTVSGNTPGMDLGSVFGETALYHSEAYGSDRRLEELNRAMKRAVIQHLRPQLEGLSDKAKQKMLATHIKQMQTETELLTGAIGKAFPMNMQQKTTFQILVAVMKSSVELNPNAMEKAGELYSHFTKVAKVETFMENPDADDQGDRYQAREKYQLMLGNFDKEYDRFGRSTLLPMFLATALVHPEMRNALSRLPLPVNARNTDGTLNAYLDNLGSSMMTKLGNKLSGQTGKEQNVEQAIAALTDQIIKTTEERRSFMSVVDGMVGKGIDRANDAVANAMEAASEVLFERATSVRDRSDNKFVKTAASATAAVAGISSRRVGNQVAEDMIAAVNRVPQIPNVFSDLINDFVGRTESNAEIYDLIKRVRNWVQQRRQQFREHLPVKIADQFSKELTDEEWTALYRGLGKTDIASLKERFTNSQIVELLKQPGALNEQIQRIEGELKAMQPKAFFKIQEKAKQLANFMNTGLPGTNLLRNADAITQLLNEDKPAKYSPGSGQENLTDMLVTLYALDQLPADQKETISKLADTEDEGMRFVFSYLGGLRKEELRKARMGSMARFNSYKGYIPTEQTNEGTLIVAPDSQFEELSLRSYVRVGDYEGSDLERGSDSMGYYYAPVSARARYQQGVLQTVQQTAGGADLLSGRTHGMLTSGVIDDPIAVRRAFRGSRYESAREPLVPIYDGDGKIAAYERSVHPERLESLKMDEHLARSMGMWRGRQVEEEESRQVNRMLIQRMKDMYDRDIAENPANQEQYVDLFNSKELKKDPVARDTMSSIPGHTLYEISQVFGEKFYVRRDMLNDALGYRDASVRNAFDGNTRMNSKIMDVIKRVLVQIFGNDAFRYATKAEDVIRNVVTDLRVLIVVKSVIVPMANLSWNVTQLITRGVPLKSIAKGFPGKASEINEYLKTRERLIDAEAELRAAESDPYKKQKLQAEIQEINDRHRRLSIWPLIEAGELTSISDGMLSKEDLQLSEGRLAEYFEKATDRLPEGVKTLAKYGLITKDTALFKGLQRSIEYGDFLGKAVLYDDLTKRQGKSPEEALAAVTEEFVNYDRLPGRSRGYLEQMGLLWFWHFKIRSTKVAVSMIRNNPVHALIAMNLPVPDVLGPIGSPITDNAVSEVMENREGYSIGPGMGMNAPWLNPWWNLVN